MAVAPAPPATAGLPARRRVEWPGLFKDAVVAALIAGLLGLPFVGLETYDIGGGALGVRTHFDRLAIVVAAMFAGRFAVQLFRQRRYPGVPGSGRKLALLSAWS
ncbi:MAG TPA: DUF3382 domain-containing protein, partial [Stellaceae bacterium]|nr:DUF3382 domain-containing protein [Stellaceae bacterium]